MNKLEHHQYEQALAALEAEGFSDLEKVEMLVEIAVGLQVRPKSAEQLFDAIALYDRAVERCPDEEKLLEARIRARKATALQMVPSEDHSFLFQAKDEFEKAMPMFEAGGTPEELAEARMNLGLILQSLAGMGKAKITDAIDLYQRALRTFTVDAYPTEYAILHNNLATAFLAIPMSDERAKIREALAVQSFQAALAVITIEDNPNEYAMLQNNLGNALQYASSQHAVENNLRALEAYEEALKVRDRRTAPLPYANTIANKANCLRNLPDSMETPDSGNMGNLEKACALYKEAIEIFADFGEFAKVETLRQAILEMDHASDQVSEWNTSANDADPGEKEEANGIIHK